MKKLFILLTVMCFSLPAFAADYNSVSPMKLIEKSFEKQNGICLSVAKNFHYDAAFSGYIRNLCNLYTADRQRTLNILFPMTQQNGKDYTQNYKTYMAEYAINMDNEQIRRYKNITDEYCKNSSFKIVKKDPEACNRLGELFK